MQRAKSKRSCPNSLHGKSRTLKARIICTGWELRPITWISPSELGLASSMTSSPALSSAKTVITNYCFYILLNVCMFYLHFWVRFRHCFILLLLIWIASWYCVWLSAKGDEVFWVSSRRLLHCSFFHGNNIILVNVYFSKVHILIIKANFYDYSSDPCSEFHFNMAG